MTVIELNQDLVITRVLNAPRERVWRAWSEAGQLAQWWGPKGCTLRIASFNFRPGGIFHYAMQFQPGQEMWGRFVYGAITAPERLEFVSSFSDPTGGIARPPFPEIRDNWPLEIHNAVTLSERDGRTTLTLRGGPINPTAAEARAFTGMFESMRQGFGGTFDQLDALLARG